MAAASPLPPIPSTHFELYLDDHSYKISAESQHVRIWHLPGQPDSIPIMKDRLMTGAEQENWLIFLGHKLPVYMRWLAANPPAP